MFKRMQVFGVAMLVSMAGISYSSAEEQPQGAPSGTTKTQEAKPEAAKKDRKVERKKRTKMCPECGKPEPQCECEGHKDSPAHP